MGMDDVDLYSDGTVNNYVPWNKNSGLLQVDGTTTQDVLPYLFDDNGNGLGEQTEDRGVQLDIEGGVGATHTLTIAFNGVDADSSTDKNNSRLSDGDQQTIYLYVDVSNIGTADASELLGRVIYVQTDYADTAADEEYLYVYVENHPDGASYDGLYYTTFSSSAGGPVDRILTKIDTTQTIVHP